MKRGRLYWMYGVRENQLFLVWYLVPRVPVHPVKSAAFHLRHSQSTAVQLYYSCKFILSTGTGTYRSRASILDKLALPVVCEVIFQFHI
eukprot:SAG22_NODE_4_length_44774_cov_362.122149_42_plen_89_part_00